MVMALMEGGAEEITQAVIDAAKAGDLAAARMVIERLAPPLRERPLALELPDTGTVGGVSAAQQTILEAVGAGELLPGEATESYHTLAGFAMRQLGRIPQVSDRFETCGFRFEIVDMDKNRVDKLLVARTSTAAKARPHAS